MTEGIDLWVDTEEDQRREVQGVVGAVFGLSAIAVPLLGG